MADTPDEAPPAEPVIDKDQMIADLRQKLADSEALVGMLKTPKKLKDGLKKDGSPDMRQTKGKALAAAAAAAVFVPVDFNDPRFNHTSRQGSISASYGLLTELLGQPVRQPNPETMAEWHVVLDGVPVTIYDRGLTETDWPLLSNADWRVGGHGPEALSAIKAMIEKKLSSQETTESSQQSGASHINPFFLN